MKIPEDWQIATLGSLGDWKGGGTPSKSRQEYWNGNIPWASPKDFKDVTLSETEDSITSIAVERSSTTLISQGSIIFVTRSGILRHKVPVALNTVKVAINQDLKALNTYAEYNAPFVFYSVQAFNDEIRKQTVKTGTTVESIDFQALKNFEIALPPTLTEQRAIATALSDTDALIAALDRLIAKKKAIKQGVMQELLKPKEGWVVKILGESSEISRGGSPRPIENFLTTQSHGINWIKIGDVGKGAKYIESTEEKIIPEGVSRSRYVKEGDFLLSNSMSFGRPYILKTHGCIHDGWLVIQNYQDNFDSDFLYYVLGSEFVLNQYKAMASGSSVLNLNKEIVKKVKINCPKEKADQTLIANILSDMDAEIAALERQRDKYKTVKQGMMQELLTGKTRLI